MSGLLASVLEGNWAKIVILVFVAEVVFLLIEASVPLPIRDIRIIASQNSQIGQTSTTLDLSGKIFFIFNNNFNIASLELIPIYGWYIFNTSIVATAQSIAVIGIVQGTTGATVVLSLLLQPHTWLELPAYAIALTQSFYLIASLFRRSFLYEMVRTIFVWMLVAAELILAATFEASEITGNSLIGVNATLVLAWIAFTILFIPALYFRSRFLGRYHAQNQSSQAPYPGPSTSFVHDQPHLYDTITVLPNPSQPQSSQSYCTNCGAHVDPSIAVYCDQCGRKLS